MSASSEEFHPARRLKWTSNELGSPKSKRVVVHIVVIRSNPRSLDQVFMENKIEIPGSRAGVSERCCTLFETCVCEKARNGMLGRDWAKVNNTREAYNFFETTIESIRRETLDKGSSYQVAVGNIDLFQTKHPSTGVFMPFARLEKWQLIRHESNKLILSWLWSAL
ncbi:hypothetical protein BCON_0428g00020 [Botryotinia convoluta]|uniref:Uncharacterized protein n=1 Tax=Botryotinia convoluta TaxID=54673 RepID=A0A4Z1HC99_9HELO|nr:hypothetical protein BCON_0428g00020 [Botryotinia convoluta]